MSRASIGYRYNNELFTTSQFLPVFGIPAHHTFSASVLCSTPLTEVSGRVGLRSAHRGDRL